MISIRDGEAMSLYKRWRSNVEPWTEKVIAKGGVATYLGGS